MSNNSDGSLAEECAFEPNIYAPSESLVYLCPCGIYGRYVLIRYPVTVSNHMEVCEVQVQPRGKGKTVEKHFLTKVYFNAFLHCKKFSKSSIFSRIRDLQ